MLVFSDGAPLVGDEASSAPSWVRMQDEDGEWETSCISEGMYGRGTSRGLSKDAVRFEYEVLRCTRGGRSTVAERG